MKSLQIIFLIFGCVAIGIGSYKLGYSMGSLETLEQMEVHISEEEIEIVYNGMSFIHGMSR